MRREFPRAVRVQVIKRATRESIVYCEECSLPAKKFQIDHVRADGLLGKPVLENARLICETCYRIKNPQDTSAIALAKRREAIHLGAKPAPAAPIRSPGFARTQRTLDRSKRQTKQALPPRQLYQKETAS
jgi:5-methylcytosine-specific restriction enzyme A